MGIRHKRSNARYHKAKNKRLRVPSKDSES